MVPTAFRFLRPAINPIKPRPPANSGSVAGSGVALTSVVAVAETSALLVALATAVSDIVPDDTNTLTARVSVAEA
jgi:hypothetical protein